MTLAKQLNPVYPILLVDNAADFLLTVEELLGEQGYTNILSCTDSRQVEELLARQPISLILLDLRMPGLTGEELLPMIKELAPGIPAIIVSVENEMEIAVRCLKEGAYDYILKNDKLKERLEQVIPNALEISTLRRERNQLNTILTSPAPLHPERPENFAHIITRHPKLLTIFKYIEDISQSRETVLITGETGTGKELIAEAIHKASGREGKFVAVNVGGLDDHLFADDLFGHKKDAFTDAKKERAGLLEEASGGTIFLDEIGDISLASQKKLLRLLEKKEYYPLGADTPHISTARVVVATNKNLQKLIKEGKFRSDLYYRLSLHAIYLPPLRERQTDIPLLVDYFVQEAARQNNKKPPAIPDSVYELLLLFRFPGNIRKLRSLIFEAVIINKTGKLSVEYFKSKLPKVKLPPKNDSLVFPDNLPTAEEIHSLLAKEAMQRSNRNVAEAAKLIGVTRPTLLKWLNKP